MKDFFLSIIKKIIFRLFLSNIDFKETSEIKKIINKSVNLNWAIMDNVMLFKNKFAVPYTIKSIKTTLYNDTGQNIGYMDFEGDIYVPKKGEVEHKIESKMSNITALFNIARFVLFDQVKVKAEGYSIIKIWVFDFKLPVSYIIKIDSKMVQLQSDEDLQRTKQRMERERVAREYKREKIKERKERERLEMEARKLEKKKALREVKNTSPTEPSFSNSTSTKEVETVNLNQLEESSKPDQDISYQDETT